MTYAPMPGLPTVTVAAMTCDLGLEPDPVAYVGHLVLCLREWRRVLRDDGTCWVNLGDSYAGGGGFWAGAPSSQPEAVKARGGYGSMLDGRLVKGGIKPQANRTMYRLRQDLTDDQVAYVMEELAKTRRNSSATQEGRE